VYAAASISSNIAVLLLSQWHPRRKRLCCCCCTYTLRKAAQLLPILPVCLPACLWLEWSEHHCGVVAAKAERVGDSGTDLQAHKRSSSNTLKTIVNMFRITSAVAAHITVMWHASREIAAWLAQARALQCVLHNVLCGELHIHMVHSLCCLLGWHSVTCTTLALTWCTLHALAVCSS
jgi:hypothetical protein